MARRVRQFGRGAQGMGRTTRDTEAGYPLESLGRGYHETRYPVAGQAALRAGDIGHPSAAIAVAGFYDHPLEAWLICAVSCGLRTEEGYGLEWSDIDLRAGVLHIERGLQWVSGHEVVVPPKTELSRRTLPLPRFAVKRLRELKPREGGATHRHPHPAANRTPIQGLLQAA